MAGGKKYPDLRYLFMRGLINHERDQRRHHYMKSAAECTSRAIVSLELADEPIRSVKQARRLEGIGGEACSRLTKLEKEKEFSCLKPLAGRFVSSAGGILVGLLDATEELRHQGKCPDKIILVPEGSSRTRAVRLTEEQFAEGPNDFCIAWWRLEVLIKRGYIRRRSQKKAPVLQLLPLGKDIAMRLRAQAGLTSTVPDVYQVPGSSYTLPTLPSLGLPGGTTPSLTVDSQTLQILIGETTPQEQKPELEDALYTNDRGLDGIVMLVDRREMGGEKHGLGELCGLLGDNGICYKTQHLKAGDYSWIWRVNGKQVVLPCLVERKRADDIARTLKERRFWSQVNRMKEWKQGFTERGIQCAIHYILERKPEEYVVKCDDGCQGIIQCGNPTLTQVKMVIEDLKRHPDLLVKETDSLNITVILLASLTAELNERAKKGDFDNLLQSELSEKKTQTFVEKTFDTSLSVDDASLDCKTVQARNPVSADTFFDEEMELAIERSKIEISKANDVLDGIPDVGKRHRKCPNILTNTSAGLINSGRNGDTENDQVILDVGDDIDADLAMVLERSKYETHGSGGAVDFGYHTNIDPEPHPLAQYHCSEGGSLHYPSSGGKSRESHANMYRPKINQKLSSYNNLKQNVNGIASTDVRETAQKVLNSSKIGFENAANNNELLDIKYRDTYTDTTQNTGRNWDDKTADINHLLHDSPCEDKKSIKRKYYKKEFLFRPDEDCVEESYFSNSDSESLYKKKPRTTQFDFTPSKDCLEMNVLQATFSKGLDDKKEVKRYQTSRNKLGKVFKMRKKEHDTLHPAETEPVVFCGSEKVKTESKCSDDTKASSVTCEYIQNDDQTNGYNSGDDLFADSDDKSENLNLSFEGKVDRSINHSRHTGKSTDSGKKKFQKERDEDDWVDMYSTTGIADDDLGPNVTESGNLEMAIASESLERADAGREISMSQVSDSGESLPDIFDGSSCIDTSKYIKVNTNPRAASPVRNLCIASSSSGSKNPSDSMTAAKSKRRQDDVTTREKRFDSGYDSDTPHHVYNEKTENNVKLVLSVLPHIATYTVREMLNKCNNNVDLCVSELL